jgi:hypothetical protein
MAIPRSLRSAGRPALSASRGSGCGLSTASGVLDGPRFPAPEVQEGRYTHDNDAQRQQAIGGSVARGQRDIARLGPEEIDAMAPLTRHILRIEGDPDLPRDMIRLYMQQATEVTVMDVQLDPIPAVRPGRRDAKPGIGTICDGD